MASEVEKLISATLLNEKSYGRWNYTELETDCPELVNSVRCRLKTEEAKPSYSKMEDVQKARVSGTWHNLSNGGMKRPRPSKEVSPIPLSGFSKVKANYLERKPLADMTECSSDACSQAGEEQSEQMDRTKARVHPSLSLTHTADDMDYHSTQTSFPSYISNLKSLDAKSMQDCGTLIQRFSRCSLSVPPPKRSPSEPEKTRSRSVSAARCLTTSDMLSFSCPYSLYNNAQDSVSSTHRLLQYRLDDDVETSKSQKKSPFQTDYWACVLPDFSPPSPDRQSPYWNPNREYQDLLDYTYPLNPKHLRSTKPTRNTEASDPFLHDSGIDLDSLSVSPESTVRSVGIPCLDKHPAVSSTSFNRKYMSPPQIFSTPLCKKPGFSASTAEHQHGSTRKVSSGEYSSLVNKADLSTYLASSLPLAERSVLSSFQSHSTDVGRRCSTGDRFAVQSRGILPTTQVLPLKKEWDSDDEYLSLPENLKELETLAGQLKNISLTVENPGNNDRAKDRSYCLGSKTHLSFEYAEDHEGKKIHRTNGHDSGDMIDYCVLGHQAHMEGIKLSLEQDDAGSNLENFSFLRDKLSGMSYLDSVEFDDYLCNRRDQNNETLVQCIKVFCRNLEELIAWLYKVAEVTDNWIPPKPEVESIKSSLELYLKFKRDIVKHQRLTTNVLEIGEILLQCMSSNAPVLKDTLGMISKQPEELEKHADQLYASVIAAMDTISDNTRANSEAQQIYGKKFESSLMLLQEDMKHVGTDLKV